MPISSDDWNTTDETEPTTDAIGGDDLAVSLVTAFLARNAEKAYTKREILVGVNLEDTDDVFATPDDEVEQTVLDVQSHLSRAAGSVVASGLVLGDIQDALDTLVANNTVECRTVEVNGRERTYYRLARNN